MYWAKRCRWSKYLFASFPIIFPIISEQTQRAVRIFMVRRAGFTCFLQQYLIKFHNHYLSHTNAIMDINKFKFILFVLISISSQLTHSQVVTLTSDIVWREKELYLLQYDKVNVPFLRLSYKNNGPDSLYFSNKFAGKKSCFRQNIF